MLSLELSPDEVETALAEWLRLRYRIDGPIASVTVKRTGGVTVELEQAAETGQSQYTLDMQQHAAQ